MHHPKKLNLLVTLVELRKEEPLPRKVLIELRKEEPLPRSHKVRALQNSV